jgi:hypothetical protein
VCTRIESQLPNTRSHRAVWCSFNCSIMADHKIQSCRNTTVALNERAQISTRSLCVLPIQDPSIGVCLAVEDDIGNGAADEGDRETSCRTTSRCVEDVASDWVPRWRSHDCCGIQRRRLVCWLICRRGLRKDSKSFVQSMCSRIWETLEFCIDIGLR